MVQLWIDALTPKQALFSKALVERAPSKVKCTVTTRNYSELNQFLSQINLKHTSVGRHGGGDLEEKLRASIDRQKLLIPLVSKSNFDFSLCFLSPEAARVSFGLGIKHYVCSDSPHANAPSRLAVPLSIGVFTPFPIQKERWTRYGITSRNVQKYHALDPWAWLKGSKVRATRKVHGRVLIRLEEWFASYFRSGMGVSDSVSRLIAGINSIGDYEITLVPRYDDQRSWAKKKFGKECIVPETTIDGASEVSKTDLLVGGGATMTQEAALLGVPNISYFPSADLDVFSNYYFPKKLSVEASTPTQLLSATLFLLKNIDKTKEEFITRASNETKAFEDPIRFIFDALLTQD
ncbi:MAG: DUF354 domain-containing protein [Nitrososphaerales archaeon]